MEFEQLICERYSVRSFKKDRLKQEDIDKILEAGHKAPTGCNYQPQRIIVFNTEESMDRLRGCTRCHFGAPAAMLICHNEEESWKRPYDGALSSPVDGAIVATYMMLAAHNIGVGCCFVMHFNPDAVRREFHIPKGVKPLALLVLGYPSEDAKPLDLHYKKRPIEETVYYNIFDDE